MKYLVLVLSCLLVAGLTGCTGSPADPATENHAESHEDENQRAGGETDAEGANDDQGNEALESENLTNPEPGNEAVNEPEGNSVEESGNGAVNEVSEEQDELLNLLFGLWTHKEQTDVTLELQDGMERIGVQNGQLLSQSEFSITEINPDEQYIVVEGTRETVSFEEASEKVDYKSKLVLQDDGGTLLYIFDYLNTQVESEWVK